MEHLLCAPRVVQKLDKQASMVEEQIDVNNVQILVSSSVRLRLPPSPAGEGL